METSEEWEEVSVVSHGSGEAPLTSRGSSSCCSSGASEQHSQYRCAGSSPPTITPHDAPQVLAQVCTLLTITP